MKRRTVLTTVAQGVLIVGLSAALRMTLETRPIEPRLECDSIYGLGCPVVQTRVGWQPGQVTPTPCGWWEEQAVPFEPVPWCASVAMDITATVAIANGDIYVIHSEGAPGETPTIWVEGTIPPFARPVFTRRALGISDYPDAGEDRE